CSNHRAIPPLWREHEEQEMAEEEAKELEVAEEDTEEENIVSYSPLSPQTSSTEQVQELNKAEENWFWGWLSPFSLFSGLPTLADRKRSQQEPICCLLDKKRPPGNTCSECEILFCRKCEGLHYNPGFIEHCILGHDSQAGAAGWGLARLEQRLEQRQKEMGCYEKERGH
uniref:Chromosome 17 open reading frame 50 n=1 Tax=Chrysemys picta bellii TaxID=8478 RepID=A0A8C3PG66_CHRPI